MRKNSSGYKKFLLLWGGEMISSIGGGLTSFGLGVYVFNEMGSAAGMSLLSLLAFLPTLILSAPAGVLADRYDRRVLMMLGDGLSGMGVLYILICLLLGRGTLLNIYIGVTVSAVFSALLEPSYKATITDLLTEEEYSKASGMVSAAGSARYLISPVLAGLLMTVSDIKLLLLIDICTFFITVITTGIVKKGIAIRKKGGDESLRESFKVGWKAVSENPGLRILVIVSGIMTCFLGTFQVLSKPIVLDFTDSTTLGTVETVCACGMLVSALILGIKGLKKNYAVTLTIALSFAGIAMTLFGIKQNICFMSVVGFLFFAALPFANTCLDYLIRISIPQEKQGRVWGVIGFLSQLGYVASYGFAGILADTVSAGKGISVGQGASRVVIVSGILLVATAVIPILCDKKMNMNIKLLMNDFRKQAWKNTVLFVFMSLTVTLAASVVLMLSQLFLTINTMYETAKPAHFLQMHMGTVNQDDIDEFNEGFEGITHWQTVPMVTLYGDNIIVSTQGSTYSLADCRLDISFVRQNDGYDVLLDEKREPLSVKDGEIGVPIIMLDQFDISLGDTIYLRGNGVDKAFKVVTFVYDGSMNSTTCSSTRFLISYGDFDSIFGRIGETEYLIEAYFTDKSLASSYQTLYEQCDKNLPKNGQAISYTVIYLLSALTDILTAVVFVLAGVLMIVVVVICLRYVILAELEDDVVEIGTMKSIGIPEKGIENLYLSKIRILMVLACVTGFAFALLFLPKFTSHITRFFGEQPLEPVSVFLAVFMVVLLFFLILLFARKILKKIRTKSIVDLMVLNDGFGKRTRVTSGLYRRNKLSTNAAVGLLEIRNGYGIVFVLMAVITFLVMVPMRFLHTMQADEMVTYMGSPECDLLVEVMQGEALEERNSVLLKALAEKKENIESLDVQKRIRIQVLNADDEPVGVHVDTGFQAGKGIEYLKGTYPVRENEIALSYLLAEELGKKLGDTVSVSTVSKDYLFEVCGIYQDVTSGGKTAKTEYDFPEEKAEKYIYQLNLLDRQSVDDFSGILKNNLGTGYSVKSMDSFLDQILGGITARLSEAVCLIINIGIVLTIFLVLLFMELRVARTMHSLAEKKGIGIPFRAILLQELYPMLLLGAGGVIVGILLSELIGEVIVSALFSLLGLGITSIPFLGMSVDCVLLPVGLVVLLGVINTGVCQKIRKVDITRYFNQ